MQKVQAYIKKKKIKLISLLFLATKKNKIIKFIKNKILKNLCKTKIMSGEKYIKVTIYKIKILLKRNLYLFLINKVIFYN